MKYVIQYLIDSESLNDAKSIAYKVLYQCEIEAQDVKVLPSGGDRVRTFEEPSEVSGKTFTRNWGEEYKKEHPWGV